MRAKDTRLTFRPSDKLQKYLSVLGIFDMRTGRLTKTNKINLSKVINRALIELLESHKSPYNHLATPEELTEAWAKYQVGLLNREIEGIHKALREKNREIKIVVESEQKRL